jgi:predicted DNA-binding transcriptional regulator YafY
MVCNPAWSWRDEMPSKIIYERFLWFNNQVKAGKYPNSRTLAEKFELSRKTTQRDIEFMRDRLNAPLVYVAEKRGYKYEENTYEFPGIWINEEELAALLISFRLASTIPDRRLKSSLKSFLQQILASHSLNAPISMDELSDRVSVKNIEYSRVDEITFQRVVDALFYKKPLMINYYSPHKDEDTERVIVPLHLLQYMGNWHLIAYCSLRNELRNFAISRIRSIKPSPHKIDPEISTGSVKEYIRRNFGLLNSDTSTEVCLKFSPDIAPWVSEQIWHPEQEQTGHNDGSLCLTFQVADLKEIKREVLKYGSQVEVLSPVDLRDQVKKEIEEMKNIYR